LQKFSREQRVKPVDFVFHGMVELCDESGCDAVKPLAPLQANLASVKVRIPTECFVRKAADLPILFYLDPVRGVRYWLPMARFSATLR